MLTHLALAASDAVIAVCPPDFMAIRSLPMLLETVEQARSIQPRLKLLGLASTCVGTRTLHERETAAHLHSYPAGNTRRGASRIAHDNRRPAMWASAAIAFVELTLEVLRRAEASIIV